MTRKPTHRSHAATVAATIRVPNYAAPPGAVAAVTQQAPAPVLGLGGDFESVRTPVQLPQVLAFSAGTGTSPEIPVFQTRKCWKGCDVFLNTAREVDGYVRIRVYEVTQGVRTEVDSAFLSLDQPTRQVWACAARSQGERYEVTFQYYQLNLGAPPNEAFVVTAIASDKCVGTRARDGAEVLVIGGDSVYSNEQSIVLPNLKVAGYSVTNGAAAPRFLHFIDGDANTDPSRHVVGVAAGATVIEMFPDALSQFIFTSGLYLAPSTTPVGFTAGGVDEVAYTIWVK